MLASGPWASKSVHNLTSFERRLFLVQTSMTDLVLEIFVMEQCWRSGESARLPLMWPGFDSCWGARPGSICGWSLLLVLALLPGFFSGFSGFPPQKPTSPNSNTTRIDDLHKH